MKLVIDIPEEEYALCKKEWDTECLDTLMIAVKYGTPLPKGHGRLVDMSEVIVKLMQYFGGNKTMGQCLDEVHTVIELDGGDAE